MSLTLKPYSITYTFFDNANVKLYDKEHLVDGTRDLPNLQIGSTLEVLDGKHFLGTIYDVHTYVEIDPNNMGYRQYVRCKNSHEV